MAPPINRRSKENSTILPSSIPLPGFALGVFAALAATFAASRALRRKKPSRSLEDEQQSVSEGNLPFEENEVVSREIDDSPFLIDSNGTITITQEPSKLAAGSLKPVFDAIEGVSFVQGRDAIPSAEGGDSRKDGESEELGREDEFEENEKGAEFNMEKERTNEGEGEIAELVVEVEASLAVDDASVKVLQSSIREHGGGQGEREAGRKRIGGGNGVIVINGEDICADSERSFTDKQPSPVLINGKKLDISKEVPDIEGESDHLLSESDLPRDMVCQGSGQEVSSAPVGPFVPATEESLEAERHGAKPGLPTDLNQSDQGIGRLEENKERLNKSGLQSAVMDVKGDSEDLEGKGLTEGTGLDERIIESTINNAEVLSNGSSSPKDLDDCESVGECELAVQSTSEIFTNQITSLQDKGKNFAERVLIDGTSMPLKADSSDGSEAIITDGTDSQKGQDQRTEGTKSVTHNSMELHATGELLGDTTCIGSGRDHLHDESMDKKVYLERNTSDEGASAGSVLEEPKLQPATQNLDNVDAIPAVDDLELEQEQPNLPVVSKGINEGSEHISGGGTDSANKEGEGNKFSGELLVEDRSPKKEREVEVTTTRSYEPTACMHEKKPQSLVIESIRNCTREADGSVLKGVAHQHGLQPKGISRSKTFGYLPLEIGCFCLLVAILSYLLWCLEVLPASSQVGLAEIY